MSRLDTLRQMQASSAQIADDLVTIAAGAAIRAHNLDEAVVLSPSVRTAFQRASASARAADAATMAASVAWAALAADLAEAERIAARPAPALPDVDLRPVALSLTGTKPTEES